jgi:hypothetical protein
VIITPPGGEHSWPGIATGSLLLELWVLCPASVTLEAGESEVATGASTVGLSCDQATTLRVMYVCVCFYYVVECFYLRSCFFTKEVNRALDAEPAQLSQARLGLAR